MLKKLIGRPSGGISREKLTALAAGLIGVYNLVVAPRAGWPGLSGQETAALLGLCAAAWAVFNRSRRQ